MKRVSVNGIEMAYEEHGHGARPLVLVHGFTGSRRDFAWRVAELATTGRVVALDLRGHGDSTNTGDAASYTIEQVADDLVAFLAAAGIEACDLLGHSMGGMAVLRAALAAPERIASLLLMNTAARCPDGLPRDLIEMAGQAALAVGTRRLLEIMRERAPESARTAADRRLEQSWGEGYWSEWREPNFAALDPVAYGAFGRSILEQPSLVPRLGEIDRPTLVMVGGDDASFQEPARELLEGIRGARGAFFEEAGHQPQFEAPAAWVEAIRAHLARVRA